MKIGIILLAFAASLAQVSSLPIVITYGQDLEARYSDPAVNLVRAFDDVEYYVREGETIELEEKGKRASPSKKTPSTKAPNPPQHSEWQHGNTARLDYTVTNMLRAAGQVKPPPVSNGPGLIHKFTNWLRPKKS